MRNLFRAFALIVLLATVAAWVEAQVAPPQAIPSTVLSGADIGFRVEGRKGTTPIGRLVVKVDGRWTEVEYVGGLKFLTH